jgi:hypothetical protein
LSSSSDSSLFIQARRNYHARLLDTILSVSKAGIPSNADKDSKLSVSIATGITDILKSQTRERVAGQTSGNEFETINAEFIQNTFLTMEHIKPGHWEVTKVGSKRRNVIAEYEQYSHLSMLNDFAKANPQLAAILGNEYSIAPDIVIEQLPFSDDEINAHTQIVSDNVCRLSSLRKVNGGKPILHASISSKWTIRSDRSQNSRAEALNLIRNRKGRLPHIVVVTGEPLPSRIASLALGTGDIDCVYHFALYELRKAVESIGAEDALEMLNIMIEGKRLKDISDLPLDLAI